VLCKNVFLRFDADDSLTTLQQQQELEQKNDSNDPHDLVARFAFFCRFDASPGG
jgi:hypothetical protein